MPPKGKSIDEKREIMLNLMRESGTIWLLKDLEKAGSKAGVVQNTVKDIVALLVGDDLVSSDKVGTSNYFWSFPGDAKNKRRKLREDLQAKLSAAVAKRETLEREVEKQRAARPQSSARDDAQRKHDAATALNASLKAELAKHAANDPAYLAKMRAMAPVAFDSANRWTDNIFLLKQYMEKLMNGGAACESVNNFFMQGSVDLDSFDYLEMSKYKGLAVGMKRK